MQKGWRKAYGAIKDTTTVSLVNLNSDFKELDVAIVKATNHVEIPPKDRYLRKILSATSIARPRAEVAYCIQSLARRLNKTRSWIVALKALTVTHRLLREGDPTFREELLYLTQRGRFLQLSNFKDDSSAIAWDCSSWVRTYGQFLEERLECFKTLKYDIEAERLVNHERVSEKGISRMRELESHDLLEQLPALQQLLFRLVGCRPEGAATNNYLIQYALALVLKESFKIYCAINDGIINLIDKFFEMTKHEALKALEIYRRAGQQAGSLSDFYEICRGLAVARNFQFPTLREPPLSFLSTMEEYVKEAPRVVPIAEPLELPVRLLLTYKPENEEITASMEEEQQLPSNDDPQPLPESLSVVAVTPPLKLESPDVGDLLGLNDVNPHISTIEESNALALAIIPADTEPPTTSSSVVQDKVYDPTGWELALVTTPSNSSASAVSNQLAGGLDRLLLDSLYDDGAYRQGLQHQFYGGSAPAPNPFMSSDPFSVSNQVAPPPSVQMAAMTPPQQQHVPAMMPPNPFGVQPVNLDYMSGVPAQNPFVVDTGFGPFPTNGAHQQANPFGSPQLI